jgi:uncharacterized protein
MFVIIITLLTTLMHAYLTWRIGTLEWFSSVQVQRSLWFVSFIIWLTYLVGIRFAINPGGKLAFLLERISMDWLGVLFIGTTVLLTVDLLTGFGLWGKPWLEALRVGAVVIALLMIAIAFFQGTRAPVISRYEVNLPHLPTSLDGSRVVMLSDLHLGSQFGPNWLAKRVEQVTALKPDLILLVGDIFEGHGPPDPRLQAVLERLQAPLGIYAVTGNHEFYGDTNAAIAMSEKVGVIWLHDQLREIAPGLILAGVEDLSVQRMRGKTKDRVSPLLTGSQKGAVILLSHTPLQVEQAATAGVGLMLSGHTHNGQIWPFNYLVAKFFPYISGGYTIGKMTLIVGRGTGLWGPRMRLWQPSEIMMVTLHSPA